MFEKKLKDNIRQVLQCKTENCNSNLCEMKIITSINIALHKFYGVQ